jgi:NADPH:quinone reductase-like Zn-dependent oxidoreductase
MPLNRAAWVVTQGNPLEVKEAPYTQPGPNEVVVKNAAVAINPVDWLLPNVVSMFTPQVKLPFVFGDDCAGTVVEVGQGVKTLKVGDRVLGLAVSFDKRSNKASEGAFQEYTVLRTNLTSKIPEWMSFESASVIPLGLATAACGLFLEDFLGLQLPTAPKPQKPTGETVSIWGGSTSVGYVIPYASNRLTSLRSKQVQCHPASRCRRLRSHIDRITQKPRVFEASGCRRSIRLQQPNSSARHRSHHEQQT